jgi:hypothetical protein
LEAQGGYDAYLGNRYRWVRHGTKKESFKAFLQKHGVELIVIDDKLRRDRRFIDDAEFLTFQANPAAFGYSTTPLPGQGRALAFPSTWATKTNQVSH